MDQHFDYRRFDVYNRRHHERFVRRVKTTSDSLLCQDCMGAGGAMEPILDDGSGPWYDCGWCEGTGFVTRWIRGLWLRTMRREKQNGKKIEKTYGPPLRSQIEEA